MSHVKKLTITPSPLVWEHYLRLKSETGVPITVQINKLLEREAIASRIGTPLDVSFDAIWQNLPTNERIYIKDIRRKLILDHNTPLGGVDLAEYVMNYARKKCANIRFFSRYTSFKILDGVNLYEHLQDVFKFIESNMPLAFPVQNDWLLDSFIEKFPAYANIHEKVFFKFKREFANRKGWKLQQGQDSKGRYSFYTIKKS